MNTVVYDKLKEKLGDEKVTGDDGVEKKLFEVVVDWEEGVTKTRAANKDLTGQREQWEAKEKEYKIKLTDLEKAKSEAEKKIGELSGTSSKKNQESEELTRKLNAMSEEITQLSEKLKTAEDARIKAEDMAKTNSRTSNEEALKADIFTELGKHKISGAQAEAAWALIKQRGNARIIENAENGQYSRVFVNLKDGKELASDLKGMCEVFAQENTWAQSASGKPGTGDNHQSNTPASGKDMSAADMLALEK